MAQTAKHLKWCLNDEKRLKRIKPDKELARQHLKKSQYNTEVMRLLEELGKHDWALNVGFYAIYHCLLAIITKHGYESRNQSCTITVILKLIEDKSINLDKDLVKQIDTFDAEKEAATPTIRKNREQSTYSIKTEVGDDELHQTKELAKRMQQETINIINT
ncbi:HEPN domain-containing protein [Candidatus Woesearchaeota archaeon]|nr:HEPN domain-containing protein [Candidatus Woesearchaeota archaeon]